MCTIVVVHRAHAEVPLVVAGNRDEFLDREAVPPRRVLDDPPAIAGLDTLGGGTWMGATLGGFFVGITNQRTHGPADRSLRSRGQLALEVLGRGGAAEAAAWLGGVDARDYNDFNLLFGEPRALHVAYGRRADGPSVEVVALPPGVHVLANDRIGSPEFVRADRAGAAAEAALHQPWPGLRRALETALADTVKPPLDAVPEPPPGSMFTRALLRELQAVCIRTPTYGTRSATVLAIDDAGLRDYRFADGPPCDTPFETVWTRGS